MEEKPTVRMKLKDFHYFTGVEWLGGKRGGLKGADKPEITFSSPPEFKGEKGLWTPEDLLVAAVETCTMLTFLTFSERGNLPLVSYESTTDGTLQKGPDGYQFTRIVIKPTVRISDGEFEVATRKALDSAHHHCLVARSLKSEVVLEPKIEVVPAG